MKKLSVNFKNCYGISDLEHDFDFSKTKTCIVYAPNGVMKTSFAKVFNDLSGNTKSKDDVFPDRETTRVIKDEADRELTPEEVFVIQPYIDHYSNNEKISTLLATKEMKEKYELIHKEINILRNGFITQLKTVSQSSDCDTELISTFKEGEIADFMEILESISPLVDGSNERFDFKYNDVFDKAGKVEKFINAYKASLDSYIRNYEEIIGNSEFFKKSSNTFGTQQASTLSESIKDNSFFEAGHKLELRNALKIESFSRYKEVLEEEITKVVNDPKLKKDFDKIDKALGGNSELRAFKKIIESNNLLLIEFKDFQGFKKKVWLGFLSGMKNELDKLIEKYKLVKGEIEKIIIEARDQRTEWESSITEFNDRFLNLPFRLKLTNREDVILKTDAPNIEFTFNDSNTEEDKTVNRELLDQVLSQGEKRSLYLLHIIFEIRARKKNRQNTLFIIDDIADSFDYKNKYAIIEYLNEISLDDQFHQIILTHNFDFYRTLHSRLIDKKLPNSFLIAIKNLHSIKLETFDSKYITNPFQKWKDELTRSASTNNNESIANYLIPLIPFVRNLSEYTGNKKSKDYKILTYLLHLKTTGDTVEGIKPTKEIKIKDLDESFKKVIPTIDLSQYEDKVLELIYSISQKIVETTEVSLNLESKIILSIAIRMKAEEYLILKLDALENLASIRSNQLVKFYTLFKKHFRAEHESLRILEQVLLMTPENIHLNSFMYEPILDLGDDHLKCLYKKVVALVDGEIAKVTP